MDWDMVLEPSIISKEGNMSVNGDKTRWTGKGRCTILMTKSPMMDTGRMISFMGMVRFTMRKLHSCRPLSNTRIGPKSRISGSSTKASLSWTIRKVRVSSTSAMAKSLRATSKMTQSMVKACSAGKMEPGSKEYGEKINSFVCTDELISAHSSLRQLLICNFILIFFLINFENYCF